MANLSRLHVVSRLKLLILAPMTNQLQKPTHLKVKIIPRLKNCSPCCVVFQTFVYFYFIHGSLVFFFHFFKVGLGGRRGCLESGNIKRQV